MSRNTRVNPVCSYEVPHLPLGEVGDLQRGTSLQRKDLMSEGTPAIHYGEVHTHYGVWATESLSYVDPAFGSRLRQAKPGDIVIATTSEDDEAVGKAVAWLGKSSAAVSSDAFIFRHSLDPKFVSYFFQSISFHQQKQRHITGAKVRRISGDALSKIRIPVPPLEVQREIVRILDKFTQLEAELEAELEARRLQYRHCRELLLSRVRGEFTPLSALGVWRGGVTPSKSQTRFWEGGDIPWMASMDVSETAGRSIRGRVTRAALAETSLKLVPAPSVIVVMRSNILRRRLPIGLSQVATAVNQDLRALSPSAGVDAEYVYQALMAESETLRSKYVRTDGSMAGVESATFFAHRIPLPSEDDQRKVALELRHFELLVEDLSSGLPAEIAARRKQYEHYRDRLLTFEEAS